MEQRTDRIGSVRSKLAGVYAAAGRFEEALALHRALREECAKSPGDLGLQWMTDSAALNIGQEYAGHGDRGKALEFLRTARGQASEQYKTQIDAKIAELTAPAETAKDDGSAMIRLLEADAAEKPLNPVPLLNLAAMYGRRGDTAKKADILRRLVKIDPSEKQYVALIETLAALQDSAGVLATYEELFAENPGCVARHVAAYASAAAREGTLAGALDLWRAKPASADPAAAVLKGLLARQSRAQGEGRTLDDAAQPGVKWFVPAQGFPIRIQGSKQEDFYSFVEAMNLSDVRIAGMVFGDQRVWAATSKGAFQFNRALNKWDEIALNAIHMGKSVDAVTADKDGAIAFTATLDGQATRFLLNPTTLRWLNSPARKTNE